MIIDIAIVLLVTSSIYRGREIGFVQQLFSTVGFFGGLVLGALLQPYTVRLVDGQLGRSLVTLLTTLGTALLLLAIGELAGAKLKRLLRVGALNKLDNGLGALLSVVSILIATWLSAAVLRSLPYPGLQQQLEKSRIVNVLTKQLPDAPGIIADLGRLIDPNGFGFIFQGFEPSPPAKINLPSSSSLLAAVNKDRAATVKLSGKGCGGVVDGSGFVAGSDIVITNAHVVAGIRQPTVIDGNGVHSAAVIWFDPDLDLAILRAPNLAGSPLTLRSEFAKRGTAAAVLGYPGGGGFTANPASVLERFMGSGNNIYGGGEASRQIYGISSDVEPGNSGGPLVAADGSVIGVIFARSTTYNNVGYALTMPQVISALNQAVARDRAVDTGRCAE